MESIGQTVWNNRLDEIDRALARAADDWDIEGQLLIQNSPLLTQSIGVNRIDWTDHWMDQTDITLFGSLSILDSENGEQSCPLGATFTEQIG